MVNKTLYKPTKGARTLKSNSFHFLELCHQEIGSPI
nr:unnamed protein product [Callosobruchus chinensis]